LREGPNEIEMHECEESLIARQRGHPTPILLMSADKRGEIWGGSNGAAFLG